MKKFVVTWTFIRHIHRHREYKILTKVIDADNRYLAEFKMNTDTAVLAFRKRGFQDKLKACTCIADHIDKKVVYCESVVQNLNRYLIEPGSTNIHVFAVKPSADGGHQAFIGFTLPNGNFSFIQFPIDEGIINQLK